MFRIITPKSLRVIFIAYVIWGWNFDLLQPIRKFFRMTRGIRSKKERRDCCPSCSVQFGKGRRRKLVDVCGHTRCYSCITVSENCPSCLVEDSSSSARSARPLAFLDKIFNRSTDKKRHLECNENGSPKRPRLSLNLGGKRLGSEQKRFSSITASTECSQTRPQSLVSNVSVVTSSGNGTAERERYPLTLKPLFFEVPEIQPQNHFQGRQWLFREVENIFVREKAVVIAGQAGTGKTSIILELVEHSCFGRKHDTLPRNIEDLNSSVVDQYKFSLAKRLVAYHFCQKNNKVTCLLPEFVHNLGAQLCQAPPFLSYRRLLVQEPRYQSLLSLQSCVSDPMSSFTHGILEPLNILQRSGKIQPNYYLLVMDAFNEIEKTELKKVLLKMISLLPAWFKVLLTSRNNVDGLNCCISLDQFNKNEFLRRDIHNFITERIQSSPDIQSNILNRATMDGDANSRFAEHLTTNSNGCFLYVKMVLNLIEKRHLVLKSESYRILPVKLVEVFQLNMNLKFNTSNSFEKIKPILEICMATTQPLTTEEIYHTLNSRYVRRFVNWKEFLSLIEVLISSDILIKRKDGTLMFLHPSLCEWMENEESRFRLNIRDGHSMIAFRLSRLECPLDCEKLLDLAHHISNSSILEDEIKESQYLPAFFLLLSASDINSSLGCLRNLSEPDVKSNTLLLKAKGNPDLITDYLHGSPIITYASYCGHEEMVRLLLQFGSDGSKRNLKGETALHMAAGNNHLSIVRLLSDINSQINAVDDNGKTPLVHAALNGHATIVSYLIDVARRSQEMDTSKLSLGEVLVSAALGGHLETCKLLLDFNNVFLNRCNGTSGHTPLTAACCAGHRSVVALLVERGSNASLLNRKKDSPIACAIKEGHWEVVEYLLQHGGSAKQTDGEGLTPLMLAAMRGYIGIMELLVSKGALITTRDKNSLTALDWACIKAQIPAARWLLDRGADINGVDEHGRTPLSLAASDSDADTIQLLLDRGADINHVDRNGLTALDRALSSRNGSTVQRLIQQGAKIGPQSWATANDKPDMLLLLFGKVLKEHTTDIERCNESIYSLYTEKPISAIADVGSKRSRFN